jgi:hypothetical protein
MDGRGRSVSEHCRMHANLRVKSQNSLTSRPCWAGGENAEACTLSLLCTDTIQAFTWVRSTCRLTPWEGRFFRVGTQSDPNCPVSQIEW